MAPAAVCHVAASDVVATASARSPVPVAYRSSGTYGLHVKVAHYNKLRRTSLLSSAYEATGMRLRTAAKDTEAAISSDALSGNGHRPHHLTDRNTLTVHGGERSGRPRVADALTTPIVQTSTYHFNNTQEVIDFQEGRLPSHEYGRYGNPTTRAVEEKIMALEGAEECLLSSSGMSSVTTMLLALVPPGGHIVTTTDCYWRTRQFMATFLPKLNISCSVIEPSDTAALKQALDSYNVALYFSESPTNPYLRCVDVPTVAKLCHEKGAIVCIDSTFATPFNQRALELGADLVLHSATKYMAGHNDVLAGVLAGKEALVSRVKTLHNILGGVVDPHAAYLVLRGLKTLGLRVERHNKTALEIARRLEAHPKVLKVHYPGLESHRDHNIAKAQMSGFGGVISFEVKPGPLGELRTCAKFIDSVKIPYIAPSLGGVESLIEQPAVQSYWSFGPERRAEIGIKENLVRYSTGIEDMEDIWADFCQAFDQI